MTDSDFNSADLTKEKKLWDIYLASRRIPFSRFNFWTTFLVFAALVLNCVLSDQPLEETLGIVRQASSDGILMSLSTLGFLLAGFTIFATISQPELSLAMAAIIDESTGLSYLKRTYFLFLRVFIYYLVFAIICLFIVMFGHSGGLIDILVSLSPSSEHLRYILINGSYIIVFTGYFFLIIQLKSFVFNIYHSVMTALRWHAENTKKSIGEPEGEIP